MGEILITRAETAAQIATAVSIQKRVFVTEQGIPLSTTADDNNDTAIHVLATDRGRGVGTARLNVSDTSGMRHGTIARVAVLPDYRGSGIGKRMVAELERIGEFARVETFWLCPHEYLEPFYANLGYQRVAEGDHRVAGHALITMRKSSGAHAAVRG